jgi:hypothetical protein
MIRVKVRVVTGPVGLLVLFPGHWPVVGWSRRSPGPCLAPLWVIAYLGVPSGGGGRRGFAWPHGCF